MGQKPSVSPKPSVSGADTSDNAEPCLITLDHCGALHFGNGKIHGYFHPIPWNTWNAIVGFHRFISKKYDAESVSYHRWNPNRKDYDTIIPFQTTTGGGLSVETDWEDKRNMELIDKYFEATGMDFFPACTIHTHVDTGAFESGTDAGDEESWPGWHMTLGKLVTGDEIDLHCRFRVPKLPRIKKHTYVEEAFRLSDEMLFPRGATLKDWVKTMGNDDFDDFIPRVTIATSHFAKNIMGFGGAVGYDDDEHYYYGHGNMHQINDDDDTPVFGHRRKRGRNKRKGGKTP